MVGARDIVGISVPFAAGVGRSEGVEMMSMSLIPAIISTETG